MLMDERDYVLCEDIKDRISKKFIENGWITVSDYGIHSALVIDENVLEVLENYCWDLRRGAGMPGVSVRYVNEKPIVNYDRLGHNKYEPFVFYRDGYGTHPSYIELSEEFRLYHNLHEKYISEEEKNYALELLSSFGKVEIVPEHLIDAVVAVSGSSPAYIFMMIEAMADGAVAEGMPRSQAYQFAAQAVLGSAKMVLETGKHPGELKDMVCSPAGTTIEAVRVLEKFGLRSAVIEAEKVCADMSRNM